MSSMSGTRITLKRQKNKKYGYKYNYCFGYYWHYYVFVNKKTVKYSNLKSSYEIKTYLDGDTIKVEVNYDFNYEKLYPLIITEIKKAIEDGKRLKLSVSFRYYNYEYRQITLYSDSINNEQDCTAFIEQVKTIIERKIYSKNCNK